MTDRAVVTLGVMKKIRLFICLLLCTTIFCFGKDIKTTVFNAGDNNINSYRIPSIVTAKDGSLLVFCEARKVSWQDKSPTDIVVKRSTDNGITWSEMKTITKTKSGAFMDPTPVVDYQSGKIMLFSSFWPADNHKGTENKVFMSVSEDNGETWTKPKDVTRLFPVGKNKKVTGIGPGSGIQMKGEKFKNRLILPLRVLSIDEKRGYDVAAYSDNQGKSWHIGEEMNVSNELQIAESPLDVLVFNARIPNGRMTGISTDGGITWSKAVKDKSLPGVSKGCQGSVLGKDSILYYSGIKGIEATSDYDERAKLSLYKSIDGGVNWREHKLLYEKGAGYSCMTFLPDGRMAVVFEAASTDGFARKSIPGTKPLKRPEGWMRIDVSIISDDFTPPYTTYYYQRVSLFEQLPITSDDIVFVGNSITDGSEWCELFNNINVKNRGISGDVTNGVYDRLNAILKGSPKKIFLMIGINDLARGRTNEEIVNGIFNITRKIKRNSPSTELYIMSILPVTPYYNKFQGHTKRWERVAKINNGIKEICLKEKVTYIDLFKHFSDGKGKMQKQYTNDGLHLTGNGYMLWKSIIESYVN